MLIFLSERKQCRSGGIVFFQRFRVAGDGETETGHGRCPARKCGAIPVKKGLLPDDKAISGFRQYFSGKSKRFEGSGQDDSPSAMTG